MLTWTENVIWSLVGTLLVVLAAALMNGGWP